MLDESTLLLHWSLFHRDIVLIFLNLIVKDVLEVIGYTIEKKSSWKRSVLDNLWGKGSKILKKLCVNLDFLIIRSFVMFVRRDGISPTWCLVLLWIIKTGSEYEWELAIEFCDKLELFYRMTEKFSTVKYPLANLYFTHVCQIRLALTKWMTDLFLAH